MFKYLWQIVNNSFFALIFGAGLTLFILFLQRQDIKIGYTVLNTNVIAKEGVDKNITILFKSDTIPNLNIVEFAFWNNGTEYIDKKNISQTIPLKISTTSHVQILNYEIEKKSRDNLNFDLLKSKTAENSEIVLNIQGDDGLERFDGLKIKILYSGNEQVIWEINGRIKGNLNSFEEYGPYRLEKYKKQSIWLLSLFLIGIILPPFLIVPIIRALKRKEVHDTKIIGSIGICFWLMATTIFCIVKIWGYIFYSGKLGWLLQ